MPAWLAAISSSQEALLTFIFGLNSIFIALVILLENREPGRTLTWLFVLFTFPLIGFILYLFFGHDWHGRRKRSHLRAVHDTTRAWKELAAQTAEESATTFEADLRHLAASTTGFPTTRGNRVSVLTDAHAKYPRLIAELKRARTSIDFEYYIFRHDDIGREIIEILKERARAGVRVRFMVDGYGSIGLGRAAFRDMRASGIAATYFAPLITPFSFFKANYRDHRKIVVIDERIAFTGGINIGDEYLGKISVGPWRDTSLEIEGPAVSQLSTLFEDAWLKTAHFTPSTVLRSPLNAKIPPREPLTPPASRQTGDENVNIIPSGPTAPWFAIHETFLSLIHGARRSLCIESPYFIPDASLLDALVNAALRGVDVKIIVPKYPDSPMLRWVAMTYIGEIVRAGGRAFEYPIGFLHPKIIIADNDVAMVGTCNIDVRSLLLDFEVNVLLSHTPTIEHILEDFHADLRISEEITFARLANSPTRQRLKESLARLLAPLL